MENLNDEVDTAFANGLLTHPIQYNQAVRLPYLQAVVQEPLWILPPSAVPRPRYAPAAGLQLSGYYIKPKTKVLFVFKHACCSTPDLRWVGMNAMVVRYDEWVFGTDAHEFRPERWLVSKERCRAMERVMLIFGAGTRICIGRHVSDNLEVLHHFGHLIIQYSSRTLRFMRSYPRFSVVSLWRWLTINHGRPAMPRSLCKAVSSGISRDGV